MNNDLIERAETLNNYFALMPDGRSKETSDVLVQFIAALSPVLPDSEWHKTCHEVKSAIVDMVDEDPNKILSRVNDILDTAFGLQSIPALSPVLPEDVDKLLQKGRATKEVFWGGASTPAKRPPPIVTELCDLIERLARENAALMDENVWLEKARQRIEELTAPVLPEDVEQVLQTLTSHHEGACQLIERLARDKVLRDEAYQALCEEGLQMEQRIEELEGWAAIAKVSDECNEKLLTQIAEYEKALSPEIIGHIKMCVRMKLRKDEKQPDKAADRIARGKQVLAHCRKLERIQGMK